jgi:hypothetical protein
MTAWWAVSRGQLILADEIRSRSQFGFQADCRRSLTQCRVQAISRKPLGLPIHAGGPCRFCGVGSHLSTLNGVSGHRSGLYRTPRGEGRILPVFVRASRAEQFVLAAALTPTLRPWWLIHALRAFRAIWLPSRGLFIRDPPPLDGVAVTLDLTCLRVPFGPYADSMPVRAFRSRRVVIVRDNLPGLAVRLLSVQPP